MIEKEKKKDRYQPCVVTIVAFDKADIVCTSQGVEKDAVNGTHVPLRYPALMEKQQQLPCLHP